MRSTQQIANELTNKKALEQIAKYMANVNSDLFDDMQKKRTIKAYINTIGEFLIVCLGVTLMFLLISLLGLS